MKLVREQRTRGRIRSAREGIFLGLGYPRWYLGVFVRRGARESQEADLETKYDLGEYLLETCIVLPPVTDQK